MDGGQGYFKLHPTGRYVHSAIDALEDLLTRVPGGKLEPGSIARIEVRTYKLEPVLGNARHEQFRRTLFSALRACAILSSRRLGSRAIRAGGLANPKPSSPSRTGAP